VEGDVGSRAHAIAISGMILFLKKESVDLSERPRFKLDRGRPRCSNTQLALRAPGEGLVAGLAAALARAT
jgi:hypothetical protein